MSIRTGTIRLQDMGSFHIGGRKIKISGQGIMEITITDGGESVKFDANGYYEGEHMYVQYFIPEKISGNHSLLLWHGGGVTGSTFETTPDGRMGWLNYFIQKGWPVYNSDAVERGRSGWLPYHGNYAEKPILFPKHYPFQLWRIGGGNGNKPYRGSQFPIESYDNLIKRLVPCWATTFHATLNAYKELIKSQDSCVIISHSQGALFAFKAAEALPHKVKAIIAIEPGGGGNIGKAGRLRGIPVLAIYGDYMEKNTRWTNILAKTQEYYDAINKVEGDVEVVFLPNRGYKGNSHFVMMDRNNLEIADFIQNWMEKKGLYNTDQNRS